MAVYEANTKSLAEFISDTKLGFMPASVSSSTGYRRNGSQYIIKANDIKCDRIYVVNDCFIDIDGNIVVASYIPEIKYFLITNELSECYKPGTHLSFEYKAESQVLNYVITKDISLKSYEDFKICIENLIDFIGKKIEDSINDFKNSGWQIKDVICDISWQIDKIKK